MTGGAGFIGSAIARTLLDQGASVRIVDNLVGGFERNVPEEAEFLHGDLRDLEAAHRACRGRDVVFHQAAIGSASKSVDQPLLSNASNVTGTLNLLVAASESGIRRLVYASSSSIYGNTEAEVNREDMTPKPQSPYAVSKLAAEQYCRVWATLNRLPTVSLRYFNVFGPGQNSESQYAAVFPAFISALLDDKPPEVHWDGNQSRDFTFIDDVVKANLLAVQAAESADGGVFNIGAGCPKSINQILQDISSVLGKWIEPVRTPKRSGDIRQSHADIGLAERILHWRPETEWHEAVRSTVRWFSNAGHQGKA